MEIYLKFNNGAESLWLPVNPERIGATSAGAFEDVPILNFGEYTVPSAPKRTTYTLSSFFPRDYNASYCNYIDLQRPWDIVKTLLRWQASGKPCRFIVTGTPINVAVTIRTFEYEERAGEPGDVYYTLELKEYAFISLPKKSDAPATKAAAITTSAARPSTKTAPATYTVKSGDTLSKIAARTLGSADKWRAIYDKNKAVIGANPNALKPGMKLVLPS
ncbi:LysM peptidoglycan-binding domain-containing protein [Paenibacillus humicus]|uniref:LysM peptidoglycan-binding domain-containing protein n=1 Tax=Paenibacillus humicus TaxID=412861 RepID=UPI000FD98E7C|nr:LysM peptidoglycan-binding domain-containing protein [Paenibacillus humicus]